jgi:hypothetical protein
MIKSFYHYSLSIVVLTVLSGALSSCKNKKKITKTDTPVTAQQDTLSGKCRLDFKSAKTLSKNAQENEFEFEWVNAKANVESLVDEKEESFDIKLGMRKDSAILVSIQYLLGLQVAKVLITKDSVKFVDYIHKTYFVGDFNYINELLNADLDFDLLQAVLFGNSAEFQEDETKLKPVTDRINCRYLLSTERKRRLKKIQTGNTEAKKSLQILTLRPEDFKILKNQFVEPATSREFNASYSQFTQKDSVYAPYHVDIEIVAQKKASIKIDYVRIEKNKPQRLVLNIPSKYDPIQIQKK